MAKLFLGNREVTPAIITGGVTPEPTDGDYLVQVVDYDGTVLKSARLNEDDTFTLPSAPIHEGLVFDGWSSPVTITNNTITVTNSDITIGPMYDTSSGLSEFNIILTEATGLTFTLNMDGTKNWGDGTSDSSTTHTYSSFGSYFVTCDGTTMTTSLNSGLFGQDNDAIHSIHNFSVISAKLSNILEITTYAFRSSESLESITISSDVTNIGTYAFAFCRSLKNIIIPSNVISIADYDFQGCCSLQSIVIPSNVTSIADYVFSACYSLKTITIPNNVTSIGNNVFHNCCSLQSIVIPSNVITIGTNVFNNCYTLQYANIIGNITTISNSTFTNCYNLKSASIPNGVTSIGTWAFQQCLSLTKIAFPSSVTTISNMAFSICPLIMEFDFTHHISVPTLSHTNAFTSINGLCKIKVPAALEAQWKTATNWSTYADYIIGV